MDKNADLQYQRTLMGIRRILLSEAHMVCTVPNNLRHARDCSQHIKLSTVQKGKQERRQKREEALFLLQTLLRAKGGDPYAAQYVLHKYRNLIRNAVNKMGPMDYIYTKEELQLIIEDDIIMALKHFRLLNILETLYLDEIRNAEEGTEQLEEG